MTKMNKGVEIKTVDAAYRHYEKTVVSHGIIRPNNSRLKWYDIASKDKSISAFIRNLAQKFLEGQAALTDVPYKNELGFVLLHRCGESFYFLMLCTWRNSNELWKTVCYLDVEKMGDFAPFPQEEQHKGTFCVWEMSVVARETLAWTQYLMSARKQEDENAYLCSLALAI
ncbi:MAG: hypothetical protein COB78_00035 [Hyphomicrobiales bacterium]|nr:MAG: hypothetical protein COB78_00035 [Hyphomicrobiales bacterium]